MKYYIGRLQVLWEEYESVSDVCIAAAGEPQARQLLEVHAAAFAQDEVAERLPDGTLRFKRFDTLAIKPLQVVQVSAVTFQEMRALLPTRGDVSHELLAELGEDERVKTLCRRIGEQLKKHSCKVPHGKLLHAMAASIGETDWQVLVHKQASAPAAEATAEPRAGRTDEAKGQQYIPGEGPLWEVPVTVDTTMSAWVKVRAQEQSEAIELACELARDGLVQMEVDEGNYRRLSDYYIGDPEGIRQLPEPGQTPDADESDAMKVRVGAYEVELSELLDVDDMMLCADLSVYYPGESEPVNEFCISAFEIGTPVEVARAACERMAHLLNRVAPNPNSVDWHTQKSAFMYVMQGGASEKDWLQAEQRLLAARR